MYLLFTTPSCPNCPRAKSLLAQSGIPVELIDAGEREGLEKARKFHVAHVPTLLELSSQSNEVLHQYDGLEKITTFLQSVNADRGISKTHAS